MIISIIYLLKNQVPITARMSDEQYPRKSAYPQEGTLFPVERRRNLVTAKIEDE